MNYQLLLCKVVGNKSGNKITSKVLWYFCSTHSERRRDSKLMWSGSGLELVEFVSPEHLSWPTRKWAGFLLPVFTGEAGLELFSQLLSSIPPFMLLVLKIALTVIQPLRYVYCAFHKRMEKKKPTRVSYISSWWIPHQKEAFSDSPCVCMWADWSMHFQGFLTLLRIYLWQILRPDHIFPSGPGGS